MGFKIKILDVRSIVPTKKHKYDAGYDLFAMDDIHIDPWGQTVVDTGIEIVELPMFFGIIPSVMQIWPRSGLDAQIGLHTGAGIVDYLYRGQVLVLLKNQSDGRVEIPYRTAIAQAVILPVWTQSIEVSVDSSVSERGAEGGIAAGRGGSQSFMYGKYLKKIRGDNENNPR